MIPPLLGREFRIGLVLNPVAKDGGLALEFARGVARLDPIDNGHCVGGGGGEGAAAVGELGKGGGGSEWQGMSCCYRSCDEVRESAEHRRRAGERWWMKRQRENEVICTKEKSWWSLSTVPQALPRDVVW
jgi:hypothetical protein